MIGRARLPTPPEEYNPQWATQFHRAIDQNLDRAFEGSPNFAEASGYYGSFYDTTTQTAAAANTAYAIKFNSTVSANQVGVTNNSRITVKNRGIYNVQFSAQLSQTSGSPHYVWLWMRRNGVNIANTTGKVSIQGSNSELVAAWNFVVPLLGGDYVEIMWAAADTAVRILAESATAFAPAIPSAIVTVTSV